MAPFATLKTDDQVLAREHPRHLYSTNLLPTATPTCAFVLDDLTAVAEVLAAGAGLATASRTLLAIRNASGYCLARATTPFIQRSCPPGSII